MIALAAILDLEIEQMDFTSAFTQGIIEEDIFLAGIDGIELPANKVLKLNRSLEGLKQSGRVWYNCISNSFKEFGLSPIFADNCVFVSNDKCLIVALHVDDFLIFSSNMNRITELKSCLLNRFKVRDMGQASVILSIKITRDRKNKKISLDQEHYIKSLMKKYKISDVEAERITTPASDAQSLLPKESNLQKA